MCGCLCRSIGGWDEILDLAGEQHADLEYDEREPESPMRNRRSDRLTDACRRRTGRRAARGVSGGWIARLGHGLEFGDAGVGPGQQFIELALRMAVDDAGDDVGEVSVRLDANQFAGLDERGDHGPVLGAAVGACEQGILARQGKRPDGALDDVIVDLVRPSPRNRHRPCQRDSA